MNCRSRGWFLGDLELNIRSKGNTGCHVATLQRREVVTSQRPEVTTSQRREFATSRCLVNRGKSTSDPTSRHHHDFCAGIIKIKGRPNFEGIKECAGLRAENKAAVT